MTSDENMHDVPEGSEALLWKIVFLSYRLYCRNSAASLRGPPCLGRATLREIVMHHLDSHGLLAMQNAVQACQLMHTAQNTVEPKSPISYSTNLRLSIPRSAQ